MACLQILMKSSGMSSPIIGFRSDLGGIKSSWICSESKSRRGFWRVKIRCRNQDGGESESNGDEPPESLFMKELKRRGMNPTSLLDDRNRKVLDGELNFKEDDRGSLNRNTVSTEVEKNLYNQRERSMALNSEGLEGLIPRARLLLTLGGTFFLAFWPLILITVAFFSALYFYFGPSFVHDATKMSISAPPYIDPYQLMEDERLSQTAPLVK
ncbi:hypothetical protein Syun_013492 [Stephania yunnanensis]|uniref:Uncharacterized protein n=1 Tax=Stephania yunnanensis TaxID=152371 RepID=A0AAP0JJR6_9MAGN